MADVPRKRRQLEAADAKDLAAWATDESLPERDRRRAQMERDRRKALRDRDERNVAVVLSDSGYQPPQLPVLKDLLAAIAPAQIDHPWGPPAVHTACVATGARVRVHGPRYRVWQEKQEAAIENAEIVIGLATSFQMPDKKQGKDVWGALRHAKDRGAEVILIWPDGSLLEGRW